VRALPPSSVGAVQVNATDRRPALPATLDGAPGGATCARGVTAALAVLAGPVPTALVAATVKV
jgi:hypothetical protein